MPNLLSRWWTRSPQSLGLASTSSGYEGAVLRGFEQTALYARQTALGALEQSADIIGRSLATAQVHGTDLLTPTVLRDIGRDLLVRGQSFHLFELMGPQLTPTLTRASFSHVYGSHHPSTWDYDLQLTGPTTTTNVRRPRSAVMHCQYATEAVRPWVGISPLTQAALTGELAARLEASLGDEASVAVMRYMTTPTGTSDEYANKLLERFKAGVLAPRKIAVLETTRQAGGLGQSSAPAKDLVPETLGPAPMPATVELYATVSRLVLDICGVPSSLSGSIGATGATIREGVRVLTTHTIQPLAHLVAAETSRVLEADVRLSFHRLSTSDPRACARLTDEGQPVEVRQREGVTDHLHPESCAGRCEAAGEADVPRRAPPLAVDERRESTAAVTRTRTPDVSETGASPHSRASSSCALASRRDAQYLRIRSATALRCSSLIARFRLPTALAAFFLPRPAAGGTLPSIASIARCMATS